MSYCQGCADLQTELTQARAQRDELAAALTRCCHTMAHAKNCEKRAEQGPEACTCGVSSAYDAARVVLAKVSP